MLVTGSSRTGMAIEGVVCVVNGNGSMYSVVNLCVVGEWYTR